MNEIESWIKERIEVTAPGAVSEAAVRDLLLGMLFFDGKDPQIFGLATPLQDLPQRAELRAIDDHQIPRKSGQAGSTRR